MIQLGSGIMTRPKRRGLLLICAGLLTSVSLIILTSYRSFINHEGFSTNPRQPLVINSIPTEMHTELKRSYTNTMRSPNPPLALFKSLSRSSRTDAQNFSFSPFLEKEQTQEMSGGNITDGHHSRRKRMAGEENESLPNQTTTAMLTQTPKPPEDSQKSTSILEICFSVYTGLYDGEVPPDPSNYKVLGKELTIFSERRFVDVCLPLYLKFSRCVEYEYLTMCTDLVTFIHSPECQRPSEDDKYFDVLLLRTMLEKDHFCFNAICNGLYRVVVRNVSGITAQVWVQYERGNGTRCDRYYGDDEVVNFLHDKERATIVWTVNTFFPSCYSFYGAVWLGDPDERGINKFWDYLPLSCRVSESLLVSIIAFIGLSGVIGNLVVVIVMFKTNRRSESRILRTSLAFADLFMSTFVIIPSLADHLSPILGSSDLSDSYQVIEYDENLSRIRLYDFPDVFLIGEGYRLFQGMVLGVCSFVSIFSLFLLSAERLIITGRELRYGHYVSVTRAKIAVILVWTSSIANTLLFMYTGDGSFAVTWSHLLKLPIGTSIQKHSNSIVYVIILVEVGLLTFACIITVIFSIISVVKFLQKQRRIAEERRSLNMRITGRFSEENRQILATLLLMILFHLLSTIPRAVKMIHNHLDYPLGNEWIVEYISWWMFLAGSAWNPWIYNMRSKDFREDTLKIFQALVPHWLRVKFRGPEAAAK